MKLKAVGTAIANWRRSSRNVEQDKLVLGSIVASLDRHNVHMWKQGAVYYGRPLEWRQKASFRGQVTLIAGEAGCGGRRGHPDRDRRRRQLLPRREHPVGVLCCVPLAGWSARCACCPGTVLLHPRHRPLLVAADELQERLPKLGREQAVDVERHGEVDDFQDVRHGSEQLERERAEVHLGREHYAEDGHRGHADEEEASGDT